MGIDPLGVADQFTDPRGYHYVEASQALKDLCLALPDSKRVQVPPLYRQQFIPLRRDGDDFSIVIQAWKGNLPSPFPAMPGGIGGEVGIYRTDPGRRIPRLLDLPAIERVPAIIRPQVELWVSTIIRRAVEIYESGVPLWWPFPEMNEGMGFKLIHPRNGEVLFTAQEPRGGYWNTRWMTYVSFETYRVRELAQGRGLPAFSFNYDMEINVGPYRYRWGAPGTDIERIEP